MLKLDGITKSFGSQEILRSVTMSVRPGETVCLFGPSGWGKSTILNIACGIMSPDHGHVIRDSERIGYAFQKDLLLPWKNALENLAYILQEHYEKNECLRQAELWLEKTGLSADAGKKPAEMSGGMRKRLSIARAFSIDPDILLLDEPFAFLDHENVALVQKLILDDEKRSGRATILVTHTREHAFDLGCRIIEITERPITIQQ